MHDMDDARFRIIFDIHGVIDQLAMLCKSQLTSYSLLNKPTMTSQSSRLHGEFTNDLVIAYHFSAQSLIGSDL